MKGGGLPLLLMGESVGLEEALVSAAESPVTLLPLLAAWLLSLRLGGVDDHLVFCTGFVLRSELLGQGSGEKPTFERSGLLGVLLVPCMEQAACAEA